MSSIHIEDVNCDANNPKILTYGQIESASKCIKDGIRYTACQHSSLSADLGMDIYFKKEFLQYTGSFKERGARYTLMQLNQEEKNLGVIAASAGNHALALAYHGRDLGIPVTVVMPCNAPMMKIQKCKLYGAQVIVQGSDISESKHHAMKMGKKLKLSYINGYDHPNILAGQGTIGLEIVEQVPDLDAVLIPVGGGGLIAGIAVAIKHLKPEVKIIGVESAMCSSFTSSMQAGKPVFVNTHSTIADGLAVPLPGYNSFATAAPLIDRMVVVKEKHIALSILRLIEQEKAVVEGAGATGLAAIIAGCVPELKGKKVVIPLCGGNIDTTILGRCLERGMAADGRLCRFMVTVTDRPKGIAELTKHIASIGVSIKDIFHERAWLQADIFSVIIRCVVETRDRAHASELESLLHDHYEDVRFGRDDLHIYS